MNGRITMAAIAARAGVHVTTVSAALRNRPTLPLVTRQRIQMLAAEMGYRPDPALSALVAYRDGNKPRKTKIPLAYITNWESMWGWKESPAHAEFYQGASARADQLGYRLEHFWLGAPGLTHERLSDLLQRRGINGLIFASQLQRYERPVELEWSRFAAVKIDFSPRQPTLHNITNDQRAAMQLAVEHARAAGYRRIGCVMPTWWDDFVERTWSAGFLAEQFRHPEDERVPLLMYPDVTRRFAVPHSDFARWYETHRPDLIISYAPFVLPVLAALRLSVPRDVAYVDVFVTEQDAGSAGIRQHSARVGGLAVETVVAQLQQYSFGLPPVATTTYVEGVWRDGASMPIRGERAQRRAVEPVATAAG